MKLTAKTIAASTFITVILTACTSDFGTATKTYTKATAVYVNLEELRSATLVAHARDIVNPGKIFSSEKLLLIGEEGYGIHVIDNSDSQNPRIISFLEIPHNREFYVSDDYIYAESAYDLLKIDVRDPRQPQLVIRLKNAIAEPMMNDKGEAIVGFEYKQVTEKVEINDDSYFEEIVYFDFQNELIPPSAVPASFVGNSAGRIGVANRIVEYKGYVYTISQFKLSVFDDQDQLAFVTSTYEGAGDMETIYPIDDRLYVGASNSVTVFDISTPDVPVYFGSFSHGLSCDPVLPINENTAYVTLRTGDFAECPGNENALLVLDIDESGGMSVVQEFEMNSPFGMTLIGDLLYVGEGESGLMVYDASDRRSLRRLKADDSVEAYDVLPHPTNPNMLLIASPEGLQQYRIDNQMELLLISQIDF